jgi:hypothetical protein
VKRIIRVSKKSKTEIPVIHRAEEEQWSPAVAIMPSAKAAWSPTWSKPTKKEASSSRLASTRL